MLITLRPAVEKDIEACAKAMYTAFITVDKQHGFPSYFTDFNHAKDAAKSLITNPHGYGIVATENNRVIASAFINEKRPTRAIGPVSVHPDFQGKGIGRKLMENLLERAQDAPSIRLTQDAFNTTSLSLYTSFGFALVESLVWIEGKFKNTPTNVPVIHPIQEENRNGCIELCQNVAGIHRVPDNLTDTHCRIQNEHITAYTVGLSTDGYTFAETENEMRALMLGMAAQKMGTLSCLMPTQYTDLLLWCLSEGFKIKKPLNLMVKGAYQKPNGFYFPNLLY
ncbi:MAG: GNAT family N-acetyltransferase [Candidatus Latescibacteria bacterium]|jgi:ribosomal protein S18 acetylase RimI-like enzyme|nr:GNAT family N-acetyltransferase [Candidatus Latescibacterota bacterium]MBT5832953.1 GNAT family N-acetyltransferase [Candidatus Latescibacterota bacterium]